MRSVIKPMKRPFAALLCSVIGVTPVIAKADTLEIGKPAQVSGKLVADTYVLPDGQKSSFIALVPSSPISLAGDDPNSTVVAAVPDYLKEIALVDVSSDTPNALNLSGLVGKSVTVSGKVHAWEEALQPVHPFIMTKTVEVIEPADGALKKMSLPAAPPVTGWSVSPMP